MLGTTDAAMFTPVLLRVAQQPLGLPGTGWKCKFWVPSHNEKIWDWHLATYVLTSPQMTLMHVKFENHWLRMQGPILMLPTL